MTGEEAIQALNDIHAIMCYPYDWSADTPEAVGGVLTRLGYTFPDREEVEDVDYLDIRDAIIRHRPQPVKGVTP